MFDRARSIVACSVATLAFGGAVTVLFPSDTTAHQALPRFAGDQQVAYYARAYPPNAFPLQWWFHSNWPNPDGVGHLFKAAVLRSDDAWNALKLGFFRSSGYREINYPLPYARVRPGADQYENFCRATRDDPAVAGIDERPLNIFYWEPAPKDSAGIRREGETTVCSAGGQLRSFAVVLNRGGNDDWYAKRSRRDIVYGQFDLQGIATHELGHATGFLRHFNEPLDESGVPDEWSMQRARCGETSRYRETMCPGGESGQTWERSLGVHDQHSFRGAYP